MHLKTHPVMALPNQNSKDHLRQIILAQSHLINTADPHHQNLITRVAHLIINTKDLQAVVDVIVAAECVAEGSVAVVASADRFPLAVALEAGEAGEAEGALKVAINLST